MANWIDCKESLPEPLTEVLVWVDGHRGSMWSNNYALVAYQNPIGVWCEERHRGEGPLVGVIKWAAIEAPGG